MYMQKKCKKSILSCKSCKDNFIYHQSYLLKGSYKLVRVICLLNKPLINQFYVNLRRPFASSLTELLRNDFYFLQAFCLSGSVGRTGGATPGKALLGLRVVTASAVISVEGRPKETVLLYPGRPLSFNIALFRSLMKNFLISLLFPLCLVLFVFRHNRTGYDLLCGVIVVEENMFPPRRHAP